MTSVFISYRRSDSASSTGRIADRLKARFGEDRIFFDVDTIPLGIDFRQYVGERLDKTDVFLVVIGDDWLEAKSADGARRIDDPADNVHVEVAAALARSEVPVIPVLVGAATSPPSEEQLPAPLRGLTSRNAISLRSDTTFEGQMERLVEYVESLSEERRTGQHRIPTEPGRQAAAAPPQPAKKAGWGARIGVAVAGLLLLLLVGSYLGEDDEPSGTTSPGMTVQRPEGGTSSVSAAATVRVPDVVGENLAEATALLDEAGLEFDWDYEGDLAFKDVAVLETDPPAGESVAPGTEVMLYAEPE